MMIPTPESGSPEPDSDWGKKVKRLLDERTSINLETGCWEYSGTNSGGYGQIMIDHVFYYVHRLSAMMYHDYTPEMTYLHVLHTCNNRCCWNPAHIYLGDNNQNIQDKMEAGNARGKYSDVTQCINGHEFTEQNTYWYTKSDGKIRRQCRECKAIKDKEYKAKRALLKFGKVG